MLFMIYAFVLKGSGSEAPMAALLAKPVQTNFTFPIFNKQMSQALLSTAL